MHLKTTKDLECWPSVEFIALTIREMHSLYPLALILLASLPSSPQRLPELLALIKHHKLETFFDVKPVLNGNDAMKEFGVQGKDVKGLLDVSMRWQVRNPTGNRDQAMTWIRDEHLHTKAKEEENTIAEN